MLFVLCIIILQAIRCSIPGVCPLRNTVLLEHQYFQLSCKSNFNATCTWKYFDQRINNGDIIAPRFSAFHIWQNGSQCDLVTSKARLTHSGSYECEIFSNTVHSRKTYSAHAIVLGLFNIRLVSSLHLYLPICCCSWIPNHSVISQLELPAILLFESLRMRLRPTCALTI